MDANFISRVHPDADLDRLFACAQDVYAAAPFLRFDIDYTTLPVLEARLVAAGYDRSELLMIALSEGQGFRVEADPWSWSIHPGTFTHDTEPGLHPH